MTETTITEDPLERRPVRDFKLRSAFAETLEPFARDWCIHTRRTSAALQLDTIRSVASGRVTITTPSTPPGMDCRSG